MAEVYWIRKQEHTDIFTQGYVGVTSKTAQDRFKEHIRTANSKASKKSILHKVIKSVGKENLLVETLCICSEEYAYDVEKKLRPSEYIGWNQIPGGTKPPSARGRVMKDSTKNKISLANSGPPSERKLKALLEHTIFKPGHIRSESSKEFQKESIRKKGPWNNYFSNKDMWKIADELYLDFSAGMTRYSTAKSRGFLETSINTIFKYFKKGWVPLEDPHWISEFKGDCNALV